jgi:hypothetical protein
VAQSAAEFRDVFRHALTSPAKLRQLRERVRNPITLNAFDVLMPIRGSPYPHLVRREVLTVPFNGRIQLICMTDYVVSFSRHATPRQADAIFHLDSSSISKCAKALCCQRAANLATRPRPECYWSARVRRVAMNCPGCSHDESRVLRTTGDPRERECTRCRHRWRTLEMSAEIAGKLAEAAEAARTLAAILPEG